MSSIFLAAFLSMMTRSMQKGSYTMMIDNAVKLSTGYIQVHSDGYWEKKSIDKTFINSTSLLNEIKTTENVTTVIPRLESFALASSGNHTKGTLIFATEPQLEDSLNNLADRIIEGNYLTPDDEGIIVAQKLAEYLQVSVGDTLVLLGQGYHGVTAAGQFEVKGIFYFPIPQLNNQLAYLTLHAAQYFYAAPDRVTSYSIMISDPEDLTDTYVLVKNKLSDKYEVMTWDLMNREMVQAIESDNIGGIIMLAILYLVIGFGVFGTVMMMTMERRKEFAIMIAIGMQKTKLFLVTIFETMLIGIIAIIFGVVVSYPLLYYYYLNPIQLSGAMADAMLSFGVEPILPFSVDPLIFVNQSITVIIITIVAILYPLSIILRFNLLKAMRS